MNYARTFEHKSTISDVVPFLISHCPTSVEMYGHNSLHPAHHAQRSL